MTIKYFILILLWLTSISVLGQKNTPTKIIFQVDTFRTEDKSLKGKLIVNRADSACIHFDSGFKNDTLLIVVDNKIKRKRVFASKSSTGYAGSISIPKTKKMTVTIYLNGQLFESFNFNKKFSVAHVNYSDKRLALTYTNKVYYYE